MGPIKVLFTEEQIKARAKEIASEINKEFKGEDLYIICTLRGAFMWTSELVKYLEMDTDVDFIVASSYGGSTVSSGVVKIKKDIEGDIKDRNVIIIEDILDTGNTLKLLKEYMYERQPKCVKICTMLDKPARRTADIVADYVGFSIENLFVVGYGLDYDQKYRNLPYVGYLEG